jgi:hypothetical protein
MHVSDLISFLVTGNPYPDQELAEVRGEVSFAQAIEGHLAWRQCLANTVLGKTKAPLKCIEVCDETGCLLGRWIDGAGQQRYGDLPSFAQLRFQHKRFHDLACEALELSASGRMEEARQLVEGDFMQVSTEIIDRMKRLQALFGA